MGMCPLSVFDTESKKPWVASVITPRRSVCGVCIVTCVRHASMSVKGSECQASQFFNSDMRPRARGAAKGKSKRQK